ncbi:hypothetical protein WDW37_10320 [Bdellovibrionota bacterium FG-1]
MKRPLPQTLIRQYGESRGLSLALSFLFGMAFGGCAAPLDFSTTAQTHIDPVGTQVSQQEALQGVKISFHYSDYYTLTNPNSSNCAGDVRYLYDPMAIILPTAQSIPSGGYGTLGIPGLQVETSTTGAQSPMMLPKAASGPDETIRPTFIKNVAVDLTDANAHVPQNLAYSCSIGSGVSATPVSSCATFDYGALGGVSTSLGGSLFLFGGIQDYNYAGRLPASVTGFNFQGSAVSCGQVLASAGATSCSTGVYTLGVNRLPPSVFATSPDLVPGLAGGTAPTEAISTWANLSAAMDYTGPKASAGASASYDAGIQKILLFGGSAPLDGLSSTAPGVTTYDTWAYDLKAQSWSELNANIYVLNSIMNLYDTALDIRAAGGAPANGADKVAPFPNKIPKSIEPRGLFGYVAVPGMAMNLDAMTKNGTMTAGLIDSTDRLLIIGGYGNGVTYSETHRFNPTYGPDIMDGYPGGIHINYGTAATNGLDVPSNPAYQWIDSYHTQVLSNSYGSQFPYDIGVRYSSGSSLFSPDFPPLSSGPKGGDGAYNTAFAPLVNIGAAEGIKGTGYVLAAGGFQAGLTNNVKMPATTTAANAGCTTDGAAVAANGANATLHCGGGLSILTRYYDYTLDRGTTDEGRSDHWGVVTNLTNPLSTPITPAVWTQQLEDTTSNSDSSTAQTVPWVGGATMLPGFDLTTNDVVFFGGMDCSQYLISDGGACAFSSNPGPGNPGRYWSMGANPGKAITTHADKIQAPTAMTTPPPALAGMASARGLDPKGNILILAWGGAKDQATIGGANAVYYFDSTKIWTTATPATANDVVKAATGSAIPAELINASMVFSHVTHKFYVFGGYDVTSSLSKGDTWELTVSATADSDGACQGGAGHYCTFTWRKLTADQNNTGGALSCYPSCPQARRSHRIAEVNYDNKNPGGMNAPITGEQTCTATSPCSYGIFMEGGTNDGFHFLSDRWMFDPTANGGAGHWQMMGDLPPRTLASMTSVDYTIQSTGIPAHRAVLFGGETGLHSPEMAATEASNSSTRYFVPPTLGDTWIFDYDNSSWNRVQLLGKGYEAFLAIPDAGASEIERRQAYVATGPDTFGGSAIGSDGNGKTISELSPPPLSGAVMVTRTMAPPSGLTATTPLRKLSLPEVYLIGGRTKKGAFNTLDHVYKFCIASTGEAFTGDSPSIPNNNDYICDAYDTSTNTLSPNPQPGYVGRWLRKAPEGTGMTSSAVGSFMGAGAYDPIRDRIVLFGGLTGTTNVTDAANTYASAAVYEYTPPQPSLSSVTAHPRDGRWSFVPNCGPYDAPEARYGHSMAYDTLNQSLILTGGYDTFGKPLTQTIISSSGKSYQIPEVWTGTYYASNVEDGSLNTKNPGVLVSNAPCYYWKPITTFGNSFDVPTQAPPETGLSHAASVFIPSTGYNTGYYTLMDNACEKEGPIANGDPAINKLLAGGAYIDIDRNALGANENLLLTLTFLPLGTKNLRPDGQAFTHSESAVFKVHLIKTGQTADVLQSIQQPRHLAYADSITQYPEVAQSLSIIAPPTGQIMQEQVLIPLSMDPGIDRIRIERYSGSGILLDASVFRMGSK